MDQTFPAVGNRYFVDFHAFQVQLYFASETSMTYTDIEPGGGHGHTETVAITVEPLGHHLFLVTWQEADKSTVVHIENYLDHTIITNITSPELTFSKYHGQMTQIV